MYTVCVWVFSSVIALVTAIYIYSRHAYNYFRVRGIPYEPPTFPLGNIASVVLLKKSYNEFLVDLYRKHKGKQMVGFFNFFQKTLLIIDPELAKNVLVKDFKYFNAKDIYHSKDVEPLSANLFALDGDEWKFLRNKMTPVFSTVRLKQMFPTMLKAGEDLLIYLEKVKTNTDTIQCKSVFTRYALELLASMGFGMQTDVFTNKNSEFFNTFSAIMKPSIEGLRRNALLFFGKTIAKPLRLRTIPKSTHDFTMKLVGDVVEYRDANNKERNDFIQIMMNFRKPDGDTTDTTGITFNEIAAQAYIFILAGLEATSNTMSFFMYEMACNPDIQRRILDEIDLPDTLTYDNIEAMEYFDMAFNETLRKYGTIGFLGRACSQDYTVPATGAVIEKGTSVLVSSYGLHNDHDLFPDPDSFNPERFSKENFSKDDQYKFMPFGSGPRICIGMKFGKIAVKLGLALVLKKYRVEPSPHTPVPIKYEECVITTTPKGGVPVRLVPRLTKH